MRGRQHYPAGHDEEVIGKEIVPIIRAVATEKKLPLIDIHAVFDGKRGIWGSSHGHVAVESVGIRRFLTYRCSSSDDF